MRVVGVSKRTRRFAAAVMMAVASFVAVARGSVLCLCDEDPDDCGHACHECGRPTTDGIAHADDCLHLDVTAVDLALAAGGVRLPLVFLVPRAIPQCVVLSTIGSDVVPCATSPPPRPSVYRSYSTRLFPRS